MSRGDGGRSGRRLPAPLWRLRRTALDARSPGRGARRRGFAVALAAGVGSATYLALVGSATIAQGTVQAKFAANVPHRVSVRLPEDRHVSAERADARTARLLSALPSVGQGLQGVVAQNVEVGGHNPEVRRRGVGPAVAVTDTQVFATTGDPVVGFAGRLVAGRSFDTGFDRRGARVMLVGRLLAEDLDLDGAAFPVAVELAGMPFTVVGVASGFGDQPELLNAAFVPLRAIRGLGDVAVSTPVLTVRTAGQAAAAIAPRLSLLVAPNDPSRAEVAAPAVAQGLEDGVRGDLRSLARIAGLIALLSGAIVIAGATFAGVAARTSEFGLRRALGARRSDVMALVALESVRFGVLGASAGTAGGLLFIVARATQAGFRPPIPWALVAALPLLGALVSLVGALLPAIHAARIEPSSALRA